MKKLLIFLSFISTAALAQKQQEPIGRISPKEASNFENKLQKPAMSESVKLSHKQEQKIIKRKEENKNSQIQEKKKSKRKKTSG